MEIIGELINTSRKLVRSAVEERNAEFVVELAKKQEDAGAAWIDVNAGTFSGQEETDALVWLVETVQEHVETPLCVDSPNTAALRAALPLCLKTPMINSVTAETDRYLEVAPLAVEFDASIVALCMGDSGVPVSSDQRVDTAGLLVEQLESDGIPRERMYFDPIVQSIGTDPNSGLAVLDAIRSIRSEIPESHVVLGMSNISFGLPLRKVINRSFMVLAMGAGADSLILDPGDVQLMSLLRAAEALLGRDEFCMGYIQAFRSDQLAT